MEKYKIFFGYMVERLNEPSTFRGLLLLATALGAKMTPEVSNMIIENGLLIAGAVAIFTPDSWERAARNHTSISSHEPSSNVEVDDPDA